MMTNCPRCQRRIIFDNQTKDFEHECNSGNPTLDNEDVVVMGDWTDYTGSGFGQNVNTQGAENILWGSRAWIEGGDNEERTRRGAKASTHRQRQHLEFIHLKGGMC